MQEMGLKQSMRCLSLISLVSLAMVGCAQQDRVVEMAAPTAQSQMVGAAVSKVMLRGAPNEVRIVDIRSQKRSGLLTVQTEVINEAGRNRTVYWRYRWLDDAGMQISDDEPWKPQQLLGHQSIMLRGSAMKTTAADFRLEMNVEP
jgi:uncharacterized protein YcfL